MFEIKKTSLALLSFKKYEIMLKGKGRFGFGLASFSKKGSQMTAVQRYHSQAAHSYSYFVIIPFRWIGLQESRQAIVLKLITNSFVN